MAFANIVLPGPYRAERVAQAKTLQANRLGTAMYTSTTCRPRTIREVFLGPKMVKQPLPPSRNRPVQRVGVQDFFSSIRDLFSRALDPLYGDDGIPQQRASSPGYVSTRFGLMMLSVRLDWASDETSLKRLSSDIQEFSKDHPGAYKELKDMVDEIRKKLRLAGKLGDYIPPVLGVTYTGL